MNTLLLLAVACGAGALGFGLGRWSRAGRRPGRRIEEPSRCTRARVERPVLRVIAGGRAHSAGG
jgi:hypothetical protein